MATLWKKFESFSGEYPVILSTTHSLRTCAGSNYLFDYVIIDDASQVYIVTGALAFCNQKFYNNELIILTEENGRDKPLIAYKTAQANHAREKYNQRQIVDVILKEVIPKQIGSFKADSVGIVSTYRMKSEKLKDAIGNRNIEIDTVHKYQGREKEIIIITTVVNEVNDFVNNPNLINVAVSPAIDKLIVVVSDNVKNEGSHIYDFVRYIDYNNFAVINSSIYSVFDVLYQ